MKNTELILNGDGSLYHLNLHVGDVARNVITVGDPERVPVVSAHFDSIQTKKGKREFITHTGRIGGKEISVISTGIGTDNIDIVLNELHSLSHMQGATGEPYNFIRLGTSGAVREEIPINSVLLSEYGLGFDSLMHFYQWNQHEQAVDDFLASDEKWRVLPRPYGAKASIELAERFKGIYNVKGTTITAPGFYAPQGRSVNAPIRQPEFLKMLSQSDFYNTPVTNIEMETAGIYALCELLGHKAISISAILANRISGEFSTTPEVTVSKMIEKALEIIVDEDL